MYAVVSTGGKQLKVEKGTVAVVEKLDGEPGHSVDLDVVFLADGAEIVVDPAKLAAASVTAEIVEHFKADKVVVFKFKKRKGYKRMKGHRQQQTRIRITDIVAVSGGAKKAAKAVDGATPAEKAAKKPAARKAAAKPKAVAPKAKAAAPQAKAASTEAAKPAAKKPAAAKAEPAAKPAAKKPAAKKPSAKKAEGGAAPKSSKKKTDTAE